MEIPGKYYVALAVFVVWIMLRFGIHFYRRHARMERLREQAEEEALQEQKKIAESPPPTDRPA